MQKDMQSRELRHSMDRSLGNNTETACPGKPNHSIPTRLLKCLQNKLNRKTPRFRTFTRKRDCQELQANDTISSHLISRDEIDLCSEEDSQKRNLSSCNQRIPPSPLEDLSIEKATNKESERAYKQDTLDALKMLLAKFHASGNAGAEKTTVSVNSKTSSQNDVQIQRTKQEQTKIDDWTRNALNEVLADFSYHENKSELCEFSNEEEIIGVSCSSCHFDDESNACDGDISLLVAFPSERTKTRQTPWKDEDSPDKCDDVDITFVPFPVERRRRQFSSTCHDSMIEDFPSKQN